MKNQLFFTSEQKGFVLPFVLFAISIVLIILTTNVNTYKNDLMITTNHLEQLKIETLVQMARSKFKNELSNLQPEEDTIHYTFPDGNVEIKYIPITSTEYHLYFSVFTDKKTYTITNTLLLEKRIE